MQATERRFIECGFAGEEYASANEVISALQSEQNLKDAIERHQATITLIKEGIESGDLETAAKAWFDTLDDDGKRDLWVAPTKGGPFTSEERAVIRSKEFREAYE